MKFPGLVRSRAFSSCRPVPTVALLLALSALAHASEFPTPFNTEPDRSGPMPAAEAAAKMQVPPGFKTTLFAGEPDVQNPIAMAWDARGRLWVAENYTYGERGVRYDLRLRDRILIFEDKDGDGRFHTRKVFTDELQRLTSIEIGQGGVWVTCPPQVLFIPDRDGDDVPDGSPEVVLDGFDLAADNYHTLANGLRFGPDGWLYGRCGASSPAEMGLPGTPPEKRVPLRGTLWRYHPQLKIVEALSAGTTNPWGHDWDENGELFFINTVNGHLWHAFPGAHYTRPHTIDPNPFTYTLIDQHADHYHFDHSQDWSKSRDGAANAYGGGHAHVGMMIYEGDNWPASYRGHLFTLNLHGRRMNQDLLERTGSGYVGHHGADVVLSADPWFRGTELGYGPDGGVFILDWSDTGECHESTGVHRTSGRIFKVTDGTPRPVQIPAIHDGPPSDLVGMLTHQNAWFARQAQLELAARTADGRGTGDANARLLQMFTRETNVVLKLRALWSLHAIGAAQDAFLRAQLHDPNEHIRAWAIRLLTDLWPLDTVMSERPAARPDSSFTLDQSLLAELQRLAKEDPSGLVRLVLASTLQRLPVADRPALAQALVSRKEDAFDHNLPLLTWYGLIPLPKSNPMALVDIATGCELPLTRRYIARRLAEDIERSPEPIGQLLSRLSQHGTAVARQEDVVAGMAEGLQGWRKAAKPGSWDAFAAALGNSSSPALRESMRQLSVLFGDGRALSEVKQVALDSSADLAARKAALQTLIESRPPDLRGICEPLLKVSFLNPIAARGLAQFDDPRAAQLLVNAYRNFHPSERPQLLSVLVSRATFARELLEAVRDGQIPRAALTPFHVRQLQSLHDAAIDALLPKAWGELHASSKPELVATWKQRLTPDVLARADLSQGRVVFNTVCASCHRLYGEGADIGPDLTGSGRSNLDYLLENITDPSAIVSADFRMSVLELKDGRTLNGFIRAQTERTVTLQTMTEKLTLEKSEVTSIQESKLSLMPEGLLETLSITQVRDLLGYLVHPTQVALPKEARSASY